ncbi:MAG: hypothetical protein ACFN4K_00580 [Pauljensenia sp.]
MSFQLTDAQPFRGPSDTSVYGTPPSAVKGDKQGRARISRQ